MLLSFGCENYKSIREEAHIYATASTDDYQEELLGTCDNYRVLKTLLIYGANGSGKSNFVNCIEYVKNLVLTSANNEEGDLVTFPNKLVGDQAPSYFRVHLAAKNNVRYLFGFIIENQKIVDEFLYAFPNGRKKAIYDRKNKEITPGSKFKGKFEVVEKSLNSSQLLISVLGKLQVIDDVNACFNFFKDDIVIYKGNPVFAQRCTEDSYLLETLKEIYQDRKFKDGVVEILNSFDVKIRDITVEKKLLPPNNLTMLYAMPYQCNESPDPKEVYNAKLVYNDFSTDLFTEESTGIQKLFSFIYPLIDAIKNDKVLICDELEIGFHEKLFYKIIELFSTVVAKNTNAQLITTTHSTDTLTLKVLRRDQIYFTNFLLDRSTELYPLSSFNGVRKDAAFQRCYLSGFYAAIPEFQNYLDERLLSIVNLLKEEKKEDISESV